MKIKILCLSLLALVLTSISACAEATPASPDNSANNADSTKPTAQPKVLVVYFSYSGHTREIANEIHSIVGGDMFEIVPEVPYSLEHYGEVVDQAKEEKRLHARPKVKNKLTNAGDYDIVFIGFPIWWYTYPMVVATFLEETDFSGKTIVPFCTHEGSRFAESLDDLRAACPKSTILKGFEMNGKRLEGAQPKLEKWIASLNLGIEKSK